MTELPATAQALERELEVRAIRVLEAERLWQAVVRVAGSTRNPGHPEHHALAMGEIEARADLVEAVLLWRTTRAELARRIQAEAEARRKAG